MAARKLPHGLLFVAVAATLCQACFGWVGFNPTDEGFVLEGSYRILHGQWPHLDFSSIRPALSCYLHLPEVWLGGPYTLWLARYVAWWQMAAIAWWWVSMLAPKGFLSIYQQFLLAGIALCLSVHTYPLTAIHTIDGLFLLTAAIFLAARGNMLPAAILASLAVLCKQSYLFGLPLLFLLYPKMRWQLLLSGLVILGGYVLLFYTKAGPALWVQLKGQSGFIAHAIEPFLFSPGMWLGIFAGLILPGRPRLAGPAAKVTLLLLLIGMATGHYIGQLSFGVMGMATGLWLRIDRNNVIVTAMLATAWMAGISVGYNSPALGSGPLMAYILICCGVFFTRPGIQVVLWFLTWIVFSYARLYLPYREAPFHACRYPVGEVMKAGKGLYTNGYTFAVLKELDSLRLIYPTAVPLPDFCASWLQSGQICPIPSLWPNKTETRSEVVRSQIDSVIREDKGRYTWLVQRYVTAELATGWVPMHKVTPYPVVESVKKNLSVKDSTTYFMIYQ